MSVIDEYRRKVAQIGFSAMAELGIIADAEARLAELKKEVKAIAEEIDNVLDKPGDQLKHS